MTTVVIEASAGAEIVTDTRRGRALAITEVQATAAVTRLGSWRLRKASVAPLVPAAWGYRHNMTAADALCVVLAERLDADFLTDDHKLVEGPTFPRTLSRAPDPKDLSPSG